MVHQVEGRRSDAVLVAAAAAGEEKAFEELVGRHFNAVYLTAFARLGQREAAEDLAQEVFLRAFLHLGRLGDPERFGPWTCRVARNLAEDWRRRRQTASRLLPTVPLENEVADVTHASGENVREKLEREQSEGIVRRAVLSLPPDLREIVLLHYAEGLSEREIARRIGVHHSTVVYRRNRALDQFRRELSSWLSEAGRSMLPARGAAARASAIVAAVAAMSAESKSALAAASAATLPAEASGAGATAGAGAFQISTLLNLVTSSILTGVVAMTKGKVAFAVGSAAVLALMGGGAYYTGAVPSSWISPAVRISPSKDSASMIQVLNQPHKLEMKGVNFTNMVAAASRTPPVRVVGEVSLPGERYDANMRGDFSSPEQTEEQFRKEIEKQFGVTFRHDRRTTDVYLLRAAPDRGAQLKQAGGREGGISMGPGKIQSKKGTLDRLATALEGAVNRPVINETGIKGSFSYDLRWQPKAPASVFTAVRDQLGLELVPARRDVEMVVIEQGPRR